MGLSVMKACEILDISRSTYYRNVFGMKDYPVNFERKEFPVEWSTALKLKEIALLHSEYGNKKIHALANYRYGLCVNRYQVYVVFKKLGLLLTSNWREKIRADMEARREYLHKPTGINQLWQADFTEVELKGYGTYYSTNVVDYFSRYALVCYLSPSHTAEDLKGALNRAIFEAGRILGKCCFPEEMILVTDNGPAMKAKSFKKYIKDSIFRHIFARGHHPQTIGMLERFNESLKYERIYRREYKDPVEASQDIEAYRVKYNTFRPHEALGYRVPEEFYTPQNFTGVVLNTH